MITIGNRVPNLEELKKFGYFKMRNQFSKSLYKSVKKNSKIVLLSGDIGNRLFDNLKKINRGKNFFNCGVLNKIW